MAKSTRNFHLVPSGDQPYFLQATVVGLRAQLAGLGLDTSGLKVDLYLRLTNGGHRIYTDDRDSSENGSSDSGSSDDDSSDDDRPGDNDIDSDQGSDSQGSDSQGSDSQGSDSQGSDSQGSDSQGSDNQGGPDPGGNDPGGNDQGGNDQGSENQGSDNQGDNDPPGNDDGSDDQRSASPGGAGKKRPRDDDGDDNDNDDQGSPPPPPRKIVRVGDAIPAELQLQIMGNLNQAQLWNLIMAAPAGYLSADIDMFVLDARRQFAIDYPPDDSDDGGGSDGSGSGSGSGGSNSGSDSLTSGSTTRSSSSDDGEPPDRPLSLLEWVGRRLVYDPAFGTAWRARILQLIDTYLQVYAEHDGPPSGLSVIEDILYYFRPPVGTAFPLLRAARDHRPDVVHLLLLRGEPIDQAVPVPENSGTALSQAVTSCAPASDGMRTIFALIGAGADVTLVTEDAQDAARDMLQEYMVIPSLGEEDLYLWPRVVNVRGLSTREFIADPSSDYFERIRLAMYVIAFGEEDYPGLE